MDHEEMLPLELQVQLETASKKEAAEDTAEAVFTPRVARLETDQGWFIIPCWFWNMLEKNSPFVKLSAITIPFWECLVEVV